MKQGIQKFGRFLSGMVMPNIGAFIAWGLITALFIPTGWTPNEKLGAMVGPMLTYLLPLLIGYTGGKMVGGVRGGVVGGIATMHYGERSSHRLVLKTGIVCVAGIGVSYMGLGAIEYPLTMERRPARIVVTDVDEGRIARAKSLVTPERAAAAGVELVYVNASGEAGTAESLLALTDGKGYDDVLVFAPIRPLAELGDALLGFDGCMNFFAGPTDSQFRVLINLYNCHYTSTHILGSTGGNTDDLRESLRLSAEGSLRPAVMEPLWMALLSVEFTASKVAASPVVDSASPEVDW